MTEPDWLAARDPGPLPGFAEARLTAAQRWLLAAGFCRQVWDQLTDDRLRQLVDLIEACGEGRTIPAVVTAFAESLPGPGYRVIPSPPTVPVEPGTPGHAGHGRKLPFPGRPGWRTIRRIGSRPACAGASTEGLAMSSPSPTPNDLTRQQLDELDTLLQRMLGLPLGPPPDGPAEPRRPADPLPLPDPVSRAPAGWRADAPAPAARPPFVTAPVSVSLTPTAEPAVRAFAPPTADTGVPPSTGDWLGRGPMVGPGTLRGVDAPALPSAFRDPAPEPVAEEPTVLVTAPVVMPSPAAPGLPLPLWPLAAVNWVMETALSLLGPVGGAMVRPAGKNVLAVVGGGLLVAAAVWTARGMGWIELPLPK